MLIPLDDVATHLRLDDPLGVDELENLLAAAVDYVEKYMNRAAAIDDVLPPSIRAAILLVVGDLYENRESQIVGVSVSKNQTVENLLNFYRVEHGI